MVPDGGAKGGWISLAPLTRRAIIGLSVWLALIAGLTADVAEHSPKPQDSAAACQKATKEPAPGTARAAQIVHCQQAAAEDRSNREQEIGDSMMVATWCLVIVGVGQALLFLGQLRAMRAGIDDATTAAQAAADSVGLARDEFAATHRPRLRLRRISNVILAPDHQVQAVVDIANIGETNADLVGLGFDIFYRERSDQTPVFHATPSKWNLTIPAGGQATITVIGINRMDSRAVGEIKTGGRGLCFLMIANYRDSRQVLRSTSAFRLYDHARRRFLKAPDDDEFAEWEYED